MRNMLEEHQVNLPQAQDDLPGRYAAIRAALLTVLDAVDYTAGACNLNMPVGAVLPTSVIALARKALSR